MTIRNQLITPKEFIDYEHQNSRCVYDEWIYSINPEFKKYHINSLDLIEKDVYPTYRLDETGEKLTSAFEDKKATPITILNLSIRPELIDSLLKEGYVATNDTVIAYHCNKCGILVIKDGIHRLVKWAVDRADVDVTVYQVSSPDWSRAIIDMPNYCKCLKNTKK